MSTSKKSKRRGKKGKKRVNTRLLAIVSLITIMVVVVVGGLIWLKYKGSVTRNLTAARSYLAEGNYDKAMRAAGKVLYRESGNQEAHALRIQAIEGVTPDTPVRAARLYREYLQALAQHAQFSPGDDALALRALDEYWTAAMSLDLDGYWGMLEALAEDQRVRFDAGSPTYNRATLMLGLAKMRLGQSDFLGDVDETGHIRFPGEAELIEYVELEPESDPGLARLAFGRMAVARQLGLKGHIQQEARNLEMAQATYDRALEVNPEGPDTLLAVVRHLYLHELISELRSSDSPDEIESKLSELNTYLEKAERVITGNADAHVAQMMELVRFLTLIDLKTGHERAARVLDAWVAAHPDDLHATVLLAAQLREIGELDRAEALVEAIIASETLPVSLGSQRQQFDKLAAAVVKFDLIADQRDLQDSELLARDAEHARDEVLDLVGGNAEHPLVLQLDGRLAYRQGKYGDAVYVFEQALAATAEPPVLILRQNADALEQIGQTGMAVARLQQAITAEPRSVQNRMLLATLYARMRDHARALEVLDALPSRVRDEYPEVAQLEQSLRVATKRPQSRGEFAEGVDDAVLIAIARADDAAERGDLEAALAELRPLRGGPHAEDVRLLVAMAQLEARSGHDSVATQLLDEAIRLQPDNERLKTMRLQLESTDPIELVRLSVAQRYAEGAERDVALFVSLQALARGRDARADRAEAADPVAAEADREVARRAREASQQYEEVVRDAAATNPQAFAFTYETMLSEGRFDEAEALLPAARESNQDKAGGNLLEARLLLARGKSKVAKGGSAGDDLQRAAAAARRATELAPWRGTTWRVLAEAMIALGELEEARLAYEQLIQRDPTDSDAIRVLASLHLQEGGDPTQAVTLLRDGARRYPGNDDLREAWLIIEAVHGNSSVALRERYSDWLKNPDDRMAALWYAGLLATLEPAREYIFSPDGRPAISGREWLAMSSDRQTARLNDLQEAWLERIDTISNMLDAEPDTTLRQALQHATILREAGRHEDLLPMLNRYLDGRGPVEDLTNEPIQIAGFLSRSGRLFEAEALLLEYQDRQDPKIVEVDAALGAMLHGAGQCASAIPHLRTAAETRVDFELKLRLADCLLQVGHLDEAAEQIAALEAEKPDDYQVAMLKAGLHRNLGRIAEGSGRHADAVAARESFRASLERASSILPDRAAPYVELVRSLVLEYRRTLDRAKLEQAMRYLDAAASAAEQSENLVIERANVLEAMGDPRAAVIDLEAYLRGAPSASVIRARLAQAYVAAGTPGRAIDTLEKGIAAAPRDPYWYGLLADHLRQSEGDLEAATANYIKAWDLQPSRRRLTALQEATRTGEAWDYEAALKAVENHPGAGMEDPRVLGIRARAEAGLGLASRSRETLREAHALYAAAVAEGRGPAMLSVGWYEDLYAVYDSGPLDEPLALIESVAGNGDPLWEKRGQARFFILRGGNDVERAITLLEEIVSDPNNQALAADLRDLGSAQLMMDRDADATKTFARVLELTPDDPIALNNYAYLLAVIKSDPEAAEPIARRAIELSPREPVFLDTMATIQEKLGNYEAALASLMARLSLEPNNGPLLQSIAMMLVDRLDRASEAVPYAERALTLDPRGAEALDVAGWAGWKSGDTAQGRDRISQSLRRQPTPRGHLHMAEVLLAADAPDDARDHLQQAEQLATDDDVKRRVQEVRAALEQGG
ncbi:MAG: tetratricopeptide repeat protein [Phycisphaerales bacterium]|jgi:tetratricopeptide (TPR) repeat protein|nr:tetratricopeptide repeat protein [Phycisphaerales bacterium]